MGIVGNPTRRTNGSAFSITDKPSLWPTTWTENRQQSYMQTESPVSTTVFSTLKLEMWNSLKLMLFSHGTIISFWMLYYAAKAFTGWLSSKTGTFLCSIKMLLTEQSTYTLYPAKLQKSLSRISYQTKLPIITWFMSIKLKTGISIFQVSTSIKFNYTKMINMN
jgi:hypothetical protein